MNSRKIRRGRGSAGLGPGRRPRRRSGSSKGGSGSCAMSAPRAAVRLGLVLAQLVAVQLFLRVGVR